MNSRPSVFVNAWLRPKAWLAVLAAAIFVPVCGLSAASLPEAVTLNICANVASGQPVTNATLNGSVNPNGASTSVWFEYGLTESYGSLSSSMPIGDGTSNVIVSIPIHNLTLSVDYHYRVIASNAIGAAFGSDKSFYTGPLINGGSETFSWLQRRTIHETSVTQRVDQFSVRLTARMAGGTNRFDQTFAVPFSAPAVQAAVAQAWTLLTNGSATVVVGPRLLTATQWVNTSSMQTSQTNEEAIVGLRETFGPNLITTGDFGFCSNYIVTNYIVTNFAGGVIDEVVDYPIPIDPWDGHPETFVVCVRYPNFDTRFLFLVDIMVTNTVTDTYLTSEVYELIGYDPPVLRIETVAGGNVRVFWPIPIAAFVLDASPTLAPPAAASWTQVPFPYQTNGTHLSITTPPTATTFYRLRGL